MVKFNIVKKKKPFLYFKDLNSGDIFYICSYPEILRMKITCSIKDNAIDLIAGVGCYVEPDTKVIKYTDSILFYEEGFGVERNFKKAAEWMGKAARAGNDEAATITEEFNILEELQIKSESGDAGAMAQLAERITSLADSFINNSAENDYQEALKLARKAAELGSAHAMWILGLAYEHGRGVDADMDNAIVCFKKGAELGDANSMHNLGCIYMEGNPSSADKKKAFELFSKSAELGYGLAMQALGSCYQLGYGCECNIKKTIEWYEKALEINFDPKLAERVMACKALEKINKN